MRLCHLLLITVASAVLSAQPVGVPRIAIVAAHNHHDLMAAARSFEGKLKVEVFGTSNEPSLQPARGVDFDGYDLVFAEGGGNQFLFLVEALEQAKRRTKVLVIKSELVAGNIDATAHPWVDTYWAFPSAVNLRRFLAYCGARFLGVRGLPAEAPIEYPSIGFYYPGQTRFFETVTEYLEWYEKAQPATKARYSIGVAFHSLDHLRGQLGPADALIREIEKQGHRPVPILFSGPVPLDRLRRPDGSPAVDAVLTTSTRLDWRNTEAGVDSAKRLGVPVLLALNHYRYTPEQWQESKTGLSPDLTHMVAMAERDGMIEPVVTSAKRLTADGDTKVSLAAQVAWRVRRAVAWAALRRKPNAEKRIVVTFHAEGGGKGDVGSDIDNYLDVQSSLAEILPALRQRGYDTGSGPLPDSAQIARDMSLKASNIGNWAPGEIARRVAAGTVDLVPESTYLRWFQELPAAKRAEVTAIWGPPPGRIMIHTDERGERYFVMPRLLYGNVMVVPHPDWGHLQERKAMFAREELPPNHQYIAFFFWLKKQRRPDAWLNLFSNLVLQGGKMEGPAADDWTAVLQGDMPHLVPTPLHGNGGMSNKRRALGVSPTFTPSIVYSDLYGELLELQDKIGRYRNQADGALRESYVKAIQDEAMRLHLDRDLDIRPASLPIDELIGHLERYLAEIRRQHLPGGSHVIGVAPSGAQRVEMVTAMLGAEFSRATAEPRKLVAAVIDERMAPSDAQRKVLGSAVPSLDRPLALAADYAARLDETPRELERLLDVLDGCYLLPGPVNDPVRNPDALPSGRNSYLFDPASLPTREAWATAGTLARQLLDQYRAKHGSYPRKVGFVLWSGESTTNLGVNEAQMLHLLGVRPVWSSNGRVVDVELIPSAELGRPRIDVFATTSGLYRDHFLDKMMLLDKAVKLAAAASNERSNGVAERTAEIRKALLAAGESTQKADSLATARIFSEAVGSYSPNIQFLAKSGDFYESKAQMAELYNSRMSHAYGAGQLGEFNRHVFSANLKSLDAAAFSRSSNVLGTLEHPMVAAYFGGMSMAARAASGNSIEMYITNLADPNAANTETLTKYFNRELRSRYFNPKWVSNMMARGYEGSRFPAAFAAHLHLWDATTPDLVTAEHWREARDVYVRDKHKLGLDKFFEQHNPFAKQAITATMLDAAESGEWDATDAEKTELARTFAESAAKHGLACEADLCRNRALVKTMQRVLTAAPGTAPLYAQFQAALNAVRPPSPPLSHVPSVSKTPAAALAQTAPASAPASAAHASANPPDAASSPVTGRVMETRSIASVARVVSVAGAASGIVALLAFLLIGWWRGGSAS
jgi:cobaltochelatase CobN